MKSVVLSWSKYHRRNEVLAPLLDAEKVYFPACFKKKWLRPIDYLLLFLKTVMYLRKARPDVVIAQCPQSFIGLAAYVARVPFVIDAHNATWQSFWHRVPGTRFLLRKAMAVIVHNAEMLAVARERDPKAHYVVISDPLERIVSNVPRKKQQVMLICSFADDEPVDVLVELIRIMPEWDFVITGSISRIPSGLRQELEGLPNLTLTGFLSEQEYNEVLCSSACAVVLTTREGCQPCGACEAVSSDTPLVLSKNALTDQMFAGASSRVDHDPEAISRAIETVVEESFDFKTFRDHWMADVHAGVQRLTKIIQGPR